MRCGGQPATVSLCAIVVALAAMAAIPPQVRLPGANQDLTTLENSCRAPTRPLNMAVWSSMEQDGVTFGRRTSRVAVIASIINSSKIRNGSKCLSRHIITVGTDLRLRSEVVPYRVPEVAQVDAVLRGVVLLQNDVRAGGGYPLRPLKLCSWRCRNALR